MKKEDKSISEIIKSLQKTVERHQSFFFNLLKSNKTLITNIISDFKRFKILSDIEDEVILLNDIAYLSAFILVNQLFFYHLLIKEKKIFEDLNLVALREDLTVEQIEIQFKKVLKRGYYPIYSIRIIENLKGQSILSEAQAIVKECISVIRAIPSKKTKHDLMGLVYHNFIPHEVRKKLAAFFTHPNAAEILCSSLITRWDQTVLDPACGSGMILTAAYRTKMNIASSQEKMDNIHLYSRFIEKEITGVDIMPFSAHLTAMNLCMQSPCLKLQDIRVGIEDSLSLNPKSEIGLILENSPTNPLYNNQEEENLTQEKKVSFTIGKVDLIIMNPPFTKKRRLSIQMKETVSSKWWKNLGSFHYWGHFLLNSLSFLKENGSIGAILPLGIIALHDGEIILKEIERRGFSPKFIMKTTKNIAFSESSKFRDYIIIFSKSDSISFVGCVYLLEALDHMSFEEARKIGETVITSKPGRNFDDRKISLVWVKNTNKYDSLWEMIELNDPIGRNIINNYMEILINNPYLTTFNDLTKDEVKITYFSPTLLRGGVRHTIFIGRNIKERTQLIINNDEDPDFIHCSPRGSNLSFMIPKGNLLPGLKTDSYVSQMDVSDYGKIISDRYPGFEDIELFFNSSVNFNQIRSEIERSKGNIAISRRFDFTAKGFVLFCFFSENSLVTTENLWTINVKDLDYAKILTLWFNSTLFLIELIFSKRKETRGSFSQVDKYKISNFHVPDLNKFKNEQRKNLLDLFDEIKDKTFPSFMTQLSSKNEFRLRIDSEFLKAFGFQENHIEKVIPNLYLTLEKKCEEFLMVMNPPNN